MLLSWYLLKAECLISLAYYYYFFSGTGHKSYWVYSSLLVKLLSISYLGRMVVPINSVLGIPFSLYFNFAPLALS